MLRYQRCMKMPLGLSEGSFTTNLEIRNQNPQDAAWFIQAEIHL